ncbi:hypothetical protein BO78DRAFT_468122 [Aspergillus sclerotiicarbonarius CBS 121057]|uniref:Uncharacterized protein n=1 Tax=Aspergillus sclerotiicarbonarius (strain CBS 121057 / IBT 28362) TaxID=1448318 RepID=A0A319EMH6_ASPSB|nr:hypothetical protein BO78DRAFT_468122 [Aspergillus sclerotiicarbonarius CBS 121057]
MARDGQRLLPFEGTDDEYIIYLETELLKVRQHQQSTRESETENGHPKASRILHILYFNPIDDKFSDKPPVLRHRSVTYSPRPAHPSGHQKPKQWEKEMHAFLSNLGGLDDWMQIKARYQLQTTQDNEQAIKFLLGRSEGLELQGGRTEAPPLMSQDNKDLIARGCKYAARAEVLGRHGHRMVLLGKFQQLIFVSYCQVMIYIGNSKDTIDWMMRRYISDSDVINLERLRNGAILGLSQLGNLPFQLVFLLKLRPQFPWIPY